MEQSSALALMSRYLNKQTTLTLCCGETENLWCCNCFYVYDELAVAFYVVSELNTRHGVIIDRQPRVAGTVSGQPKTIALICGVQYSGNIYRLSGEEETIVYKRYCQRYPIARIVKAPMWKIVIDELKMTDNKVTFAKKTHWLREA